MMRHQRGSSLIEVMVALLIMAIGLLGAAAIQLNALKFTDSSTLRTKASYIAYDMMDRIRANPGSNYTLANLAAAPTAGGATPLTQDLFDFSTALKDQLGATADASIAKNGYVYTITVSWDDTRAASAVNTSNGVTGEANLQTFKLVSRVAMDTVVTP